MDTEPFYLNENLRNTRHIHECLLLYSRDADIHCIGPEVRPVEIIPAKTKQEECKDLQRVLHRAVS